MATYRFDTRVLNTSTVSSREVEVLLSAENTEGGLVWNIGDMTSEDYTEGGQSADTVGEDGGHAVDIGGKGISNVVGGWAVDTDEEGSDDNTEGGWAAYTFGEGIEEGGQSVDIYEEGSDVNHVGAWAVDTGGAGSVHVRCTLFNFIHQCL